MDEKLVKEIVSRVVRKLMETRQGSVSGKPGADDESGSVPETVGASSTGLDGGKVCETIPVGVSSRHVHTTREDFERLFGAGRSLTVLRPLSQPGQFAAQETVAVVTDRGRIDKVRLLGPFRDKTQVELSQTDARRLGLSPPVRESGKLAGTPGAFLEGDLGKVGIPEGVIVAERHIHIIPADADRLGVKNGQFVDVHTTGERQLVFRNVLVRVSEQASADFHIDTDEANAAGLQTGDLVRVCFTRLSDTRTLTEPRVISERMIREALKKGQVPGLDGKAILTPAARDLAVEKGLIKR